MNLSGQRGLAVGLALTILVITALMYPVTMPHLMHHVHHEAAMHGTAVCSWLCSAGQAADITIGLLDVAMEQVSSVETAPALMPATAPVTSGFSRAPPVLSI